MYYFGTLLAYKYNEMKYHFINLVFLGISIEGLARDRAIELTEKRGLMSQVVGGAIAGTRTPPLFSASIFHFQSCCKEARCL